MLIIFYESSNLTMKNNAIHKIVSILINLRITWSLQRNKNAWDSMINSCKTGRQIFSIYFVGTWWRDRVGTYFSLPAKTLYLEDFFIIWIRPEFTVFFLRLLSNRYISGIARLIGCKNNCGIAHRRSDTWHENPNKYLRFAVWIDEMFRSRWSLGFEIERKYPRNIIFHVTASRFKNLSLIRVFPCWHYLDTFFHRDDYRSKSWARIDLKFEIFDKVKFCSREVVAKILEIVESSRLFFSEYWFFIIFFV